MGLFRVIIMHHGVTEINCIKTITVVGANNFINSYDMHVRFSSYVSSSSESRKKRTKNSQTGESPLINLLGVRPSMDKVDSALL